MRGELRLEIILAATVAALLLPVQASAVSPPPQPAVGYGSSDNYVSNGDRERFVGNPFNPWAGNWCWYYKPKTLKYGTTAPVVVFLHGFALLAPDIYDRHIEHLTRQGVFVVYPQINKGGLTGLLSDFDQTRMLDRAVEATNRCLSRIGAAAAPGETYLYGHSLGALLGSVWQSHADAPAVSGMVLAHPSLDGTAAIPSFVTDFIGAGFVEIDWQTNAAATTVPVVVLTGDVDTIAPSTQAEDLALALVNAATVSVYMAQADFYAGEGLLPDHMAPINNDGVMPDFLMELLGGRARTNAVDHRFYWAALDAMMDGVTTIPFDMGAWSDGTPVLGVVSL